MPLVTGQTLSFYEILGPLGVGAMGEVYRALDTHLGREVAIKVLPEELAQDEERLGRFQREAQTLACLSHPNVAHVYGIDQVEGTSFMAMELVPGEDLARRLARGALPMREAIDVCRQIAEGLEAAHEAGVIHRDLKPANVILTRDGRAKLLDFGLAKPISSGVELESKDKSFRTTEAGRLLGTPNYMAPEQVRGRQADKRVDVWAFGCVLYECLTGRRSFGAETLGDVLAAVLEKEPDGSRLPAGVPAHVRALLERCLDKDPLTRLRDVGEARILLERGPDGPREARSVPPGRGVQLATVAVAILALGVLVGRFGFDRPPPQDLSEIRQQRLTDMAGMEEMPAVSPDGGMVAFVSRVNGTRQVFLRLLAKGSWIPLTRRDVDHSFPRWADENTLIYYVRPDEGRESGSIWETDCLGSSPPRVLIPDAQGEADVDHESRRIATFRTDAEGPALVLVEYGDPRRETVHRLSPGATYNSPRWSPDDRQVAFEAKTSLIRHEICVFDLDREEARTVAHITGQTRGLAWLPDGSGLVYSSSAGSTMAYPPVFRLRIVRLDGGGDAPLPCGGAGYASYVEPDVSLGGELVASRVALSSDVFRYPVDGEPLENVRDARRITRQTGLVQVPSASPSGEAEEVAYLSDSGGRANVWVARVDGSEPPRRLTDEQDPDAIIGVPVWSPQGDWITYWRGSAEGGAEQWLIHPHGPPDEHLLVRVRGGASWSSDGEWLYYMAPTDDPNHTSVERVPVGGGEPAPVRDRATGLTVSSDGSTCYFSPSDLRLGEVWKASPVETGEEEALVVNLQSRIPLWPHNYALSPDDRWLATPLRDRGTTNLWLISTADGSLRQITDFEQRATTIGRQVSWSRDGKYLFAALMESDADIVLMEGVLR